MDLGVLRGSEPVYTPSGDCGHMASMTHFTTQEDRTVRNQSPVRRPLPTDMLGKCTIDLDPVDRGRNTMGGLGPRRSGVAAVPMCLDSLRLSGYAQTLQKNTHKNTRAYELTERLSLMSFKYFSPFKGLDNRIWLIEPTWATGFFNLGIFHL
ncbi:hypothetical protein M9H77_30590 [Catharanthus roseus]|uniref:Uncharacterized protein n=1 Tax=Catharanthus roseus TaxID=4058 RepID=A0ACB9ZZY3_CATRO|nr:hypothetical protein M9H77_30590 [Catharanthus roseus]